MDIVVVLMRAIHVLCGVFWAGALIFNALFLGPALRDAGPDGAAVGAGLMRRRFLDVMPAVALLTIVSGLWLYWRVSAGFDAAYMGSPTGITLGIGAVAALTAFGIGVGMMRPAMLRAAALAQEGKGPEAQALRMRAGTLGKAVALLLTVAVVAMGIARYV